MHVSMGVWEHVSMGVCEHRSMGVQVCPCVCVCVRHLHMKLFEQSLSDLKSTFIREA